MVQVCIPKWTTITFDLSFSSFLRENCTKLSSRFSKKLWTFNKWFYPSNPRPTRLFPRRSHPRKSVKGSPPKKDKRREEGWKKETKRKKWRWASNWAINAHIVWRTGYQRRDHQRGDPKRRLRPPWVDPRKSRWRMKPRALGRPTGGGRRSCLWLRSMHRTWTRTQQVTAAPEGGGRGGGGRPRSWEWRPHARQARFESLHAACFQAQWKLESIKLPSPCFGEAEFLIPKNSSSRDDSENLVFFFYLVFVFILFRWLESLCLSFFIDHQLTL